MKNLAHHLANAKKENTMLLELQPEFDDILQPLGNHAIEFFLAASLYHAKKISFAKAAHIAGLDFEVFKQRLEENFNQGFLIAEESILEDIEANQEAIFEKNKLRNFIYSSKLEGIEINYTPDLKMADILEKYRVNGIE